MTAEWSLSENYSIHLANIKPPGNQASSGKDGKKRKKYDFPLLDAFEGNKAFQALLLPRLVADEEQASAGSGASSSSSQVVAAKEAAMASTSIAFAAGDAKPPPPNKKLARIGGLALQNVLKAVRSPGKSSSRTT